MSILYFIMRLFGPWRDSADHAVVNALLCISDALWVIVVGKIFGWW